MKLTITEKQHRDQLAQAGLDAADIDRLVKAKCADGDEYAEDGDEDEGDDEMAKAMAKYDLDLKKAAELKVRDFATREPSTNATNPETRPPDERREIPSDIDDVGDYSSLSTDIVKGAYEAIDDIVKGAVGPLADQITKALSAIAQVTKIAAEGNAIMKAQGALIKAQGDTIAKLTKATKKAAIADQRLANRTPAAVQPGVSGNYSVVPEPGERRPQGPTAEAIRDHISKALDTAEQVPPTQRDGRWREAQNALNEALLDSYDPGANTAAIATRVGLPV